MLKYRFLLFVAFIAIQTLSAQNIDSLGGEYNVYKLPSISIGSSIQSFYGDLGEKSNNVFINSNFRKGTLLSIEKRKNLKEGYMLTLMYGVLSESEKRIDNRNLNFYSEIYCADFKWVYHLDNDVHLSKNIRFSPYLIAGLGLMYFDPYTDILSANSSKYYYWKDGTIRDLPENLTSPQNGKIIDRDYVYETKLDAENQYWNYALYMPLGGGLKFKLSDMFELNWTATYNLTTSDYIDNFSGKGMTVPFFSWKNDAFLQMQIALQYNLSGKMPFNRYKHINFKEIENEDADNDGVKDFDDNCPETPSGVKVDDFGCPFDSDSDGVADYQDKEINSAPGSVVTNEGVAYTDSVYQAIYERDSLLATGEWYNVQNVELIKKKTFINISSEQVGTFYRVFLMSSVQELHPWYFKQNFNHDGVVYVLKQENKNLYYIGDYINFNDARSKNTEIMKRYKIKAEIVAFKNGQIISIEEALKE